VRRGRRREPAGAAHAAGQGGSGDGARNCTRGRARLPVGVEARRRPCRGAGLAVPEHAPECTMRAHVCCGMGPLPGRALPGPLSSQNPKLRSAAENKRMQPGTESRNSPSWPCERARVRGGPGSPREPRLCCSGGVWGPEVDDRHAARPPTGAVLQEVHRLRQLAKLLGGSWVCGCEYVGV
jgi:hypothetical protein